MRSREKDPWALLGVTRSASDSEIKKAFHKLAKQLHPDSVRDPAAKVEAEKRFRDVSSAYRSIATESDRADWLLKNESQADADSFPPYPGAGAGAAARSGSQSDAPIEKEVVISFSESYHGTQREVAAEVQDICRTCGGTGAAPGTQPQTCTVCGGSGEHRAAHLRNPCSACNGEGFVISDPCRACQRGLIHETRSFPFQIPAGVPSGYKMRVGGERRGRFGTTNLLITVKVTPSSVFQRTLSDPADLLIDVPITYSEACLGASEIRIPTPDKVIAIEIGAGTQSAKMFRIAGRGMPRIGGNGERGDLYARTEIVVPPELNSAQKKLIKALSESDPADARYELFKRLGEESM